MNNREPWDNHNFKFNRTDEWAGTPFSEKEDLWDDDHVLLYSGRWIMACLVCLLALLVL